MELELEGRDAELRAGYHTAARLPAWRLETVGPDLFKLHAVSVQPHPVYIGYRPLLLRIPRGDEVVWEWPVASEVSEPDEDGRITLLVSGDPRMRKR